MVRKAKPGSDLGLAMVDPCPSRIMSQGKPRTCIFEKGHKADGSTVFAFHKGRIWKDGDKTTMDLEPVHREPSHKELESAGQAKLWDDR